MRFLYLYRLPPLSLHNFLHASSFGFNIFALIWFEYLYFPPALASPQTSCVHLVSISKIPPRCPSATSWIHLISYLVPPSPLHIFLHASSFNIIGFLPPLVSPQLLACFVIWVQCLGFTPHLSTTYCAHLVLISYLAVSSPNVPLNFLHPFGFICRFPPLASPQLVAFMLFQYPNFSCTPWLSATSCMHLVSISRLPLSLNNFLRSSVFNI